MRYNMDVRKGTFYQKHRTTESWKVSAAQNPTFTKSPNTSVKRKQVTKLLLTSQRHHNHLVLISQIHFREAWINRKSDPKRIHDYQSCLTVFNNALEKKDQSDGFTTNHIGYFKQIRKQCSRCSWLKKNNYPHKKCFKNCIGRLKMTG